MLRHLAITAALIAGTAAGSLAQPPYPFPPPRYPVPGPARPPASPVDGVWFFRGDPNQPASIQTMPSPWGPNVIVTNEKGSSSPGVLSPDGRQIFVYDWNITGRLRGNRLVWPNGDFWAR